MLFGCIVAFIVTVLSRSICHAHETEKNINNHCCTLHECQYTLDWWLIDALCSMSTPRLARKKTRCNCSTHKFRHINHRLILFVCVKTTCFDFRAWKKPMSHVVSHSRRLRCTLYGGRCDSNWVDDERAHNYSFPLTHSVHTHVLRVCCDSIDARRRCVVVQRLAIHTHIHTHTDVCRPQ